MKIRLASPLQPDSIVDGEGIRTVVWTQGCKHHCKGCHNAGTWDFEGGFETTMEELKKELSLLKGQQGITLSGGDPLFQAKACMEIAKYAKEIGLNVWCYTGFTFEKLLKSKEALDLLEYVDVSILFELLPVFFSFFGTVCVVFADILYAIFTSVPAGCCL